MKASRLIAISVIILFSQTVAGTYAEEQERQYTDVPENHIYADGIAYMTELGYVEGYPNGDFLPMQEINRVEALKMILSFAKTPLGLSTVSPITFPDANDNEWYMPYVRTAFVSNILTGNEDGTLRPEETINRAEALKMLVLAMDLKSELPNISSDYWYSAYMAYGEEKALISPDANNDFLPGAELTRGELCDLLYRWADSPYTGQSEYGKATYYGYSFDGANTASGKPLEAYGYMGAHKTLPFGTIVRVINIDTNTYVDIEIVDRGPYGEGRIVDLTPVAFEAIGQLSAGILNVRLEVLSN
ncbi:MAG: septal ring lytic transglycosylase RlpA family protein [Candidatus Gracilibacteria bacterium]